jgi:hypothetical protein
VCSSQTTAELRPVAKWFLKLIFELQQKLIISGICRTNIGQLIFWVTSDPLLLCSLSY